MSLFELREHQTKALDMLRRSISAGKRRPLMQAACGFGKTILSAHIVHGAMTKGKRVTFCVPAISLIDQTFDKFRQNGLDPMEMGVIQGNHPWRRPDAPIQIASVQTLQRRKMPETDVMVVDECHVRSQWLHDYLTSDEARSMIAIGLSATPWSAGLGNIYDDLIKPISMRELIDIGMLSKFRVFAPSHPDLTGVRTVAGDFHEGQLAERMSKPQICADIVATWMEKAQGLPTLCFCVNRAHARLVHDQFAREGISVAYVDANTPREEREDIGRQLVSGAVQVVCNIGCLTTGIDWDVRCIIMARPTKSPILHVQIMGRALRPAPDKVALILDHSDTHLHLGMVDEIDFDRLSTADSSHLGRKEEEKEDRLPLPKECSACGCLVPSTVAECPSCGQQIRRRVNVDNIDGELLEITRGRRSGKPRTLVEQIAAKGKQTVYSELLAYARNRGRSDGWVAHAYRDVWGVWPRGLLMIPAEYPSALVCAFVRAKDIKWAKSQKSRGAA